MIMIPIMLLGVCEFVLIFVLDRNECVQIKS
jgi:hypothetical protein